ncbi:uncharacterized protein METZ01_LOCUS254701 [marine metagenome]|uniref:Uncharacterized protein n=1 Tax=marine metagenome TaxID=408172 RepID=A0A382IRM2_9ZZZZ
MGKTEAQLRIQLNRCQRQTEKKNSTQNAILFEG